MSKKQLEEISNLLLAYSAGEYHVKGEVSKDVNELDMIISGINMLGEELLATNVSRDFFSSIFNSVSDFVFIADENGNLIDVNKAVGVAFGYDAEDLINKPLSIFTESKNCNLFETIKSNLVNPEQVFTTETILENKSGRTYYGFCTCTKLLDRFGKFNGYLINIKDVTEQKEKEKLIIRTIISTQQHEQKRVADDLHDSLGQELAMAQLMIGNLAKYHNNDTTYSNLVSTCTEILQASVQHLREICFDLMPSALTRGGLSQGVRELTNRLKNQDQINVVYEVDEKVPRLNTDLEIAAYRIVQEFINNMLKHAKAKQLNITINQLETSSVTIHLKDDGIGFDLNKLNALGENRGIQNIHSKVTAFGGNCLLKSSPGKGTELIISFPVKNNL